MDVGCIGRLLERYPARRGTRKVCALLGLHDDVPAFTRSGLERRMFRLCGREGIGLPRMNVRLPAEGGPFEVDCVWFQERLIIECDSHRWHDNPVTANRDALKDQAFTLAGWRVHRLRWIQIVKNPQDAARTIGVLLEQQRSMSLSG